ncbi:hypothetical protein [Pseudomonas lini]
MNKKLQVALVKALEKASVPWVKSPRCDSDGAQDYCWLPVLALSEGRVRVGVLSNGLWVVANDRCIHILPEGDPCIFLLPVLESSPQVVLSLLVKGFREGGLSEEYVDLFPFEAIVFTALKSNSEYWSGLGLEWVEFIARSPDLQVVLENLSRESVTQKIRHQAKKMAKFK